VTEKLYLNANQLLTDAFKLGVLVVNSGFKPNYIVAIWRGGAPIGIAVQEILQVAGIKSDHIPIRTSSYTDGIDQRQAKLKIHGLRYLIDRVNATDSILLVDDVYDTGRTIKGIIDKLDRRARQNSPNDIRIAVPYYKPSRNLTGKAPDYFLHKTEKWIKFPHSLEGLDQEEIMQHRPEIWKDISQ